MAVKPITSLATDNGGTLVAWSDLDTGDTGTPFAPHRGTPLAGSVQFTGTVVTSVGLQRSNDGTNWVAVKDLQGNDITLTAAGMAEFSCAARFLRPLGTTATDVVCTLFLRG
jgi:hypothetical protein